MGGWGWVVFGFLVDFFFFFFFFFFWFWMGDGECVSLNDLKFDDQRKREGINSYIKVRFRKKVFIICLFVFA